MSENHMEAEGLVEMSCRQQDDSSGRPESRRAMLADDSSPFGADYPSSFPDTHDSQSVWSLQLVCSLLSTLKSVFSRYQNFLLRIGLLLGAVGVFHFLTQNRFFWPFFNKNAQDGSKMGRHLKHPFTTSQNTLCVTPTCTIAGYNVLSAANFSSDPCENPYTFACGSWLAEFELPEDETSWTLSFSSIEKNNRNLLHRLSENLVCEDRQDATPVEKYEEMLGCLYQSCMDTEATDALGSAPLEEFLQSKLPFLLTTNFTEEKKHLSKKERGSVLGERLGALQAQNVDVLYGFAVQPSILGFEGRHMLHFGQGGFGLSYKYYDQTDMLEKYRRHLVNLFTLYRETTTRMPKMEDSEISHRVNSVVHIEKLLKNISLTPEEQRDPVKTTIPQTWRDLKLSIPYIDLDEAIKPFMQMFPATVDFTDDTIVFIDSPSYFPALSSYLENDAVISWEALHDYFLLHTLRNWGTSLSAGWREEFERYSVEMTGSKIPPRWRICLAAQNSLGWILARKFVLETDAQRSKQVTEAMVDYLKQTFALQLKQYMWMDEETSFRAIEKLNRMTYKISHPSWLVDNPLPKFEKFYGLPNVEVMKSHFSAQEHILRNSMRYLFSKLGELKDPFVWHMYPHTVNAYFNPSQNEIVFPASILRPPFIYFWDISSSDAETIGLKALSFGALGSVIAHEITHGFDDSGRHFNADGQLVDWWSHPSAVAFEKAASCVSKQYGDYYIELNRKNTTTGNFYVERLHLSGDLTLGENIADNGGARLAFLAFKSAMGENSLSSSFPLPGVEMSAEQLFFLGYSQTWCSVYRDEVLRQQILSDPHSPGKFRVEGVLSNLPQYLNVMNCTKQTTAMCSVW